MEEAVAMLGMLTCAQSMLCCVQVRVILSVELSARVNAEKATTC